MAVVDLFWAYPDRKWLLLGALPEGEAIFPTEGGTPFWIHLKPPELLRWTGDRKHLFVLSLAESRTKTYVLPLSPGQVLPPSVAPARDFPSDAELAKLPGVRIIPVGNVVPGPTADIYAFTRETVQRNLYRIPVR